MANEKDLQTFCSFSTLQTHFTKLPDCNQTPNLVPEPIGSMQQFNLPNSLLEQSIQQFPEHNLIIPL